MRVGIDVTPLLRARTGIGVFTDMLVRDFVASGDEVVGLISGYRRLRDGLPALPVTLRTNWVPRFLDLFFFDAMRWPKAETLLGPIDVYIATNFMLPPTRSAVAVAFIHDIGRLTRPELYNSRQVRRCRALADRWSRNADLLIAPSEAVAEEIVQHGLARKGAVRVVPLAARSLPAAEPPPAPAGVPGDAPIVLCVATLEKRKNIPHLLRAFLGAERDLPHHLVVAGGVGSDARRVFDAAGASDRIHFLGHADEAQLSALYRRADLTVCPSLYEGFGLPLLEAMTCGCPVLASDIPAHREVGGDAVQLVPPDDRDALTGSLISLVRDDGARRHLRDRGLERSRRYSWEATGRRLRESLTPLRGR